jgi:nucleotide-binding universal stress UspA family protein
MPPEAAMTRFQHILVPIDSEEPHQEPLDVAVDLAIAFDAKLTLVHAWEMPLYSSGGVSFLSPDVSLAIEQAARTRLAHTRELVVARLPRAEAILLNGPAASEILDAAERLKVDLIVMGTHGRRGVSRVLLGSVAEKIVRSSPVPVLTVRVKEISSG